MDQETTEDVKREFRTSLKDWRISESSYKVLEVIFRQAMMSHFKTGYRYNNEKPEPSLRGSFKPQKRYDMLIEYVNKWEQKTKYQYGFEKLYIDEMEHLDALIIQFKQVHGQLIRLGSKNDLVENSELSKWISTLEKKIKDKFSINGRDVGRFLKFKDGDIERVDEHHEYFVRYLGVGHAVFYNYFDRALKKAKESIHPDKRLKKGNDIYRFVAAKIRKEHGEISSLRNCSAKTVKKKMHNNRLDKNNKWFLPQDLQLIDVPFLDFLVQKSLDERSVHPSHQSA